MERPPLEFYQFVLGRTCQRFPLRSVTWERLLKPRSALMGSPELHIRQSQGLLVLRRLGPLGGLPWARLLSFRFLTGVSSDTANLRQVVASAAIW